LLAPLVVGTLSKKYNFHLGFGVAGVGMFLGLVVFMLTKKKKPWTRRHNKKRGDSI
jgi:proton-dependent oligopeptide transporter, POT family